MVVDSLAGVVLAAGAGTRLAPLTRLRPKALCPVANRPLVDWALERVARVVPVGPGTVAVNAWHHHDQLVAHLTGRVTVSVEPRPLGTAGALVALRDWIAGRPVMVTNADTWVGTGADLRRLLEGWDGARTRLVVAGGGFGPRAGVIAALHPWTDVARLPSGGDGPTGLWALWADRHARGALEVLPWDGPFVDCGTPATYLRANMAASGGASVLGPGAVVDGECVRSVLWPGVVVRAGERLVDAIRAGDRMTVLVR
jgi:MurNAc alpha-1-phosphate uridylyltransferase